MASTKKKLNPNATPYPFFPHSRFTVVSQVVTVPFHQNWGYTYVATVPFYCGNFYVQPNDFVVASGKGFFNGGMKKTERGFEEVEITKSGGCFNGFMKKGEKSSRNKMRHNNQAPRFRGNKKVEMGSTSWVEKEKVAKLSGGFNGAMVIKKEVEVDNLKGRTSLMIRNIPNQFQRQNMLQILDNHCLEENKKGGKVKSAYDFLYLPIDFGTGGNLGYAFVNFTSSIGALRFYKAFQGHQWDVPVNRKLCKICSAKLQGKAALVNHFKGSLFSCNTSEYLPVVLSPPRGGSSRGGGPVKSRVIEIGRYRGSPNFTKIQN